MPRSLVGWLRLCCGVTAPVPRITYGVVGVVLALVKYAVEAIVLWKASGEVLAPWDFVNPLFTSREALVRPAGEWLGWLWFVWSLPFLWTAVTMSVRRAASAGASPWYGLTVLVPLVNIPCMLGLALLPDKRVVVVERPQAQARRSAAVSAATGVGVAVVFGGLMLAANVYLLGNYGSTLFVSTPVMMGVVASYVHNSSGTRTWGASVAVGVYAVFFAGIALLLFALEGAICVVMALPLVVPLGAMGGALGKVIAEAAHGGSATGFTASLVLLPLAASGEALWIRAPERMVLTTIEIEAPPQIVWQNVVEFSELPQERAWYFELGLACPQRARIVGQGVGAVRYCEFSTGAFVEPITAWEPGRRLAFDVVEQPPPMVELSFYHHVHPPHLDGTLQSRRGEFLLIGLPHGRTRLEGRTWYTLEIYPQGYWSLWSDAIIHRIHERVLEHVARASENAARQ